MNKFIDYSELPQVIENIKNIYDLEVQFILYLPTNNINNDTKTIIIYKNIIFFVVEFPKIEMQIIKFPSDDLHLL